jgi:hypothetical protein
MDFYEAQNRAFAGDYPGADAQKWPLGIGSEAKKQPPDSQSGDGHPIYPFPGYGVNLARLNAADLEPIPITPVKYQNWPEMQIQLLNGWAGTNWGRKIAYDDYLKQLTTSSEMARSYLAPGRNGVALGNQRIGPSPLNVTQWMQAGPGSQPQAPGGPGQLAGALGDRRYYG